MRYHVCADNLWQTIPDNGSCVTAVTEGSKGLLGFLTRLAFSDLPLHFTNRSRTAMTASQMRIAETIDAFYGDAGAKDGVSRSYKQAVEDLDAETIKALDGPYRYASYKAT
jgi:hypothetical protein